MLNELVETNVNAVTRLTRHYLPAMRARARGGVMNLASLAAFTPGPWQAPYFASKAYVLSLTAAIGGECAGEGVRVCAIACGPVETRIHQKKFDASTVLPRTAAPAPRPIAWRGSPGGPIGWGGASSCRGSSTASSRGRRGRCRSRCCCRSCVG